jgi:hypothetical protein
MWASPPSGGAPKTASSVDRQVTLLHFRLLTIYGVSVKHAAR